MQVELVSISAPKIHGIKTPEELIVYCARVSNPSNQLNLETAPNLLRYCIKNQHWSIFEMADFCVEIKTSRAIAAQILRHKSANFQEYSQRYSSVQFFEHVELRESGKTNRQSSRDRIDDPQLNYLVQGHLRNSHDLYEKLLEKGVARECARMVLPLAVQTTLYMKNNIRNWIHYLQVRCDEHTQKEHRDIANAIKNEIFIPNFPNISEALGWK